MGVVSNKINIMELMKSGGGGDPTIPGRVSALENEMTGVYASINQISTVELPKVYNSISAVSALILNPVTGLKDRVTTLENAADVQSVSVTADGVKTNAELLSELRAAINSVYDNMSNGKTLSIDYLCPGQGSAKYVMGQIPTTKNTGISLPTAILLYSVLITSTAVKNYSIYFKTSGSTYKMYEITTNGLTITDLSSQVPENGAEFICVYHII